MQSRIVDLALLFFISNLCMTSAFMAINQSAVRAEHTYKFKCNLMNSKGKIIPVTEILYSNGKNLRLIRWESKFISNPKQKCEEVSRKFNDFSENGNLQVLKFTTNKTTNRTLICGLSMQRKNFPCDESNKLFEMSKAMKDPKEVLSGLKHSMVTIDDGGGIQQGADNEDTQIIDFQASIEQQSANR
jgi:Circadian oscillating protein COP23